MSHLNKETDVRNSSKKPQGITEKFQKSVIAIAIAPLISF
jgi:hypothetical protein